MGEYYYQDSKRVRLIEDKITNTFEQAARIIKNRFSNYVHVFGITGPMARSQGTLLKIRKTYVGSDLDLAVITRVLNPFKERELRNALKPLFKKLYRNTKVEASLLTFSPTIYKKPDLMFYEFTNSGRFILGKPWVKVSIDDLPLWEGIRLLSFRQAPFLNSFKKVKKGLRFDKHYYYQASKAMLGCGEALLLLDRLYVADNFERALMFENSKSISKLGILEQLINAHKLRYGLVKTSKKPETVLWNTLDMLKKTWDYYLIKYYKKSLPDALKQLNKEKPSLLGMLATRLIFVIEYYKQTKKIKIPLKEPFIQELKLHLEYLKKASDRFLDEKIRQKILIYWKTAQRWGKLY